MTGQAGVAFELHTPVFGSGWGHMIVANHEIQAACDRASLKLPDIVERIRLIDTPKHSGRVAA